MRAFLFCLVLGLSATVAAQTTTSGLTLDLAGVSSAIVAPGDCGNQISVTWTAAPPAAACSDLKIWVTTGQCGNTPGPGDFTVPPTAQLAQANFPTQRTGTIQIAVTDLPIFSNPDGGTAQCPLSITKDMSVCGAYTYATSNGLTISCSSPTTVTATPPIIHYLGQPPSAPVITSVVSLDSALQVSATGDSNTTTIHLEYALEGNPTFKAGADIVPPQESAKITGLVNGTTYDIRAIAEDAAGNQSNPSSLAQGTPVHTEGFFDRYKDAKGQEQGGCTTVAGAPWLWVSGLLLTGFFFARRRRG